MSAIKAGDRFRLPSGNVVEVINSKHDLGEYRCRYVQISPRPFVGEGVEFGDGGVDGEEFAVDFADILAAACLFQALAQ